MNWSLTISTMVNLVITKIKTIYFTFSSLLFFVNFTNVYKTSIFFVNIIIIARSLAVYLLQHQMYFNRDVTQNIYFFVYIYTATKKEKKMFETIKVIMIFANEKLGFTNTFFFLPFLFHHSLFSSYHLINTLIFFVFLFLSSIYTTHRHF